MVKNHLKRLNKPKSWDVKKKQNKFVARPNPGAHSFSEAVPISVLIRDLLKKAKTLREVRFILNNEEVLVDKRKVKDPRFLVGFMDVVEFPNTKEAYRILITSKGLLIPVKIKPENSVFKLSKIIGKSIVKKGKMQINLFDGRNILVEKNDFKLGDTLKMEIPSQKILASYSPEKGNYVLLTTQKHVGIIGKIDSIEDKKVIVELDSKDKIEALRKSIFVIGKEKPEIKLIKEDE